MYTAKGRLDANAMLKQYSPLVRRLAHQMIAKLPANVELDDLIQVGMIGLTDALSRFDAAQGSEKVFVTTIARRSLTALSLVVAAMTHVTREVAPRHLSFMGSISRPERLIEEFAPAAAAQGSRA